MLKITLPRGLDTRPATRKNRAMTHRNSAIWWFVVLLAAAVPLSPLFAQAARLARATEPAAKTLGAEATRARAAEAKVASKVERSRGANRGQRTEERSRASLAGRDPRPSTNTGKPTQWSNGLPPPRIASTRRLDVRPKPSLAERPAPKGAAHLVQQFLTLAEPRDVLTIRKLTGESVSMSTRISLKPDVEQATRPLVEYVALRVEQACKGCVESEREMHAHHAAEDFRWDDTHKPPPRAAFKRIAVDWDGVALNFRVKDHDVELKLSWETLLDGVTRITELCAREAAQTQTSTVSQPGVDNTLCSAFKRTR